LSRTYLEKPYNKKLAGGVAQGEGPSTKKKKKKKPLENFLPSLAILQMRKQRPAEMEGLSCHLPTQS
jgi:hypothetical protein